MLSFKLRWLELISICWREVSMVLAATTDSLQRVVLQTGARPGGAYQQSCPLVALLSTPTKSYSMMSMPVIVLVD